MGKDPSLREDLEQLVEPVTRGDPESPLRWTCKSVRKLAEELTRQGHQVSHQLVSELLHDLGYSLQANRKTREGGGSNGSRGRFWKWELQQLVDETGLEITVCHLPPGTGKWNKIEHRLFAWISQNWRGKPLTSYAVILKLIAATTTEAGLTVQCQLDTNTYPAGCKVSDEAMATLSILPHALHGEWNYTIRPREAQIDTIIL